MTEAWNKGQGECLKWLLDHADHDGEGCLTWPFSVNRFWGRAQFGVDGKREWAHRYMCKLVHGEPPPDKPYAAHECGNGATADRTYNGFDTHADALLMGCLISFIPLGARNTLARFRWLAVGFFLISLFTVRYDAPVLQYLGMTGVAGAAMVMVCSSLESNGSSSILTLRPLVFTGKISYGWYLWHYPLIALIAGHASSASATGKMLATGGAIALSYMVATASYFLIERPFLRMKTRFVANKVSSGAEAKPARIAN